LLRCGFGAVWLLRSGMLRRGGVRHGPGAVRLFWSGSVWSGTARLGWVRCGAAVTVRFGWVRYGAVRQVRIG
jgi:hypothetical protein